MEYTYGRIRESNGRTGNVVALSFGRLNPPTIGHLKLVEAILAQPADDHYLFLSHTHKLPKDPLTYDEKLHFSQRFFSIPYPKLILEESPYKTLVQILNSFTGQYNRVIVVVGSDRVEAFDAMLQKYNGIPDKSGTIPFSFDSLEIVSAGERDPDAEGAEGMSASKLRSLAIQGSKEAFAAGVPTTDQSIIDELYNILRERLGESTEEYRRRFSEADEEPGEDVIKGIPDQDLDFYAKEYLEQDMEKIKAIANGGDTSELEQMLTAAFKEKFAEIPEDERSTELLQTSWPAVMITVEEAYQDKLYKEFQMTIKSYQLPQVQPGIANTSLATLSDPVTVNHQSRIAALLKKESPIVVAVFTPSKGVILDGITRAKLLHMTLSKQISGLNVIENSDPSKLADLLVNTVSSNNVKVHGDTVVTRGFQPQITASYTKKFGQAQPQQEEPVQGIPTQESTIREADNQMFQNQSSSDIIDSPNVAQQLLEHYSEERRKALNGMRDPLKNKIGQLKIAMQKIKDPEEKKNLMIKSSKGLLDGYSKVKEEQKNQFIQLIPTKDRNLAINIYYAYLSAYREKTGKSDSDLFNQLFAAETEAIRDVGSAIGVTQAADAIKAISNSGKPAEEPQPDETQKTK